MIDRYEFAKAALNGLISSDFGIAQLDEPAVVSKFSRL